MEAKLDLDDLLESSNSRVYIRNSTRPKGQFIVTFKEPNTDVTHPFCAPKTWIPIYVSGTIPKRVIKESIDFRRALGNGMLTLLDADEAEKILAQPDAVEELARLNKSAYSSDSKFANQAAKELVDAVDAQSEQTDQAALDVETDDDFAELTPSVLDICKRVNGKAVEVNAALNELRCVEEDISAADCNYIIGNCDGKVRQWAKDTLEKVMDA